MRVRMMPGWESHLDKPIHDFVSDIASDVLRNMQANCPVDTGALLASLDKEVQGSTARIGSELDYAVYVELGTAPHVIRPNEAEALFWPGAAHPVTEVHHPGTDATHFMSEALYAAKRG